MTGQTPSPPASQATAPEQRLLRRGIAAFRAGQDTEAERTMRKVLKRSPTSPDALHILGILAARAGRSEQAESFLRRCVAAAPTYADAYNNLGNILIHGRRFAEAQAAYAKASQLAPRYPLPRYNLAYCYQVQGRLAEADSLYRETLAIAPEYVEAKVNLANVLRELEAYDEAELLYRQVLDRYPSQYEVRLNLGNVYRLRGDLAQARQHYEALLQTKPEHRRALLALALVALDEHDPANALPLIEQAQRVSDQPDAEALVARAVLEERLGNLPAALACMHKAIGSGVPSLQNSLYLADLLTWAGQRRDALEVLERSVAHFGVRSARLLGSLVAKQRHLCDWRDWIERLTALVEQIRGGAPCSIDPFAALSLPGLTPRDLCRVAQAYGAKFSARTELASSATGGSPRPVGKRLRVGYLSADFREHPCAWVSAAVFECHDRQGFETFAYAIGPPDDGPMRRRLRSAFDHFVELGDLSHTAAAQRIVQDNIDILVDMQGYTRHARPQIPAMRPAPIQVSWLGFPGTMGVPWIDYLIVDPSVVRLAESEYYTEALAYLPHCYLSFDSHRPVEARSSRAAEGLPEGAFILCSFNNPYKVTPEVFTLWCALLRDLPSTILWLYAEGEARGNLASAAAAAGVNLERIYFADKRPQPEHLGRLALADLFLDTWPYNAHTTAMDALSVGLPVLTCRGSTFPSRVAASLLTVLQLPELIADNPADYLARASRLVREPRLHADLRTRISRARGVSPLFEATGFAGALEALYRRMWARHWAGRSPADLVPASANQSSA